MFVLAAVSTKAGAERLQEIPTEFWIKMGIGVAVLVALVIVLRKLAKMNKVLLSVIVFVIVTMVGFNWIYERNEPDWATPAVNWLAGFFPTKGTAHKNRQPSP
jgi:apolipoprotein N-acyltransferase